jgi:hypothetical protein
MEVGDYCQGATGATGATVRQVRRCARCTDAVQPARIWLMLRSAAGVLLGVLCQASVDGALSLGVADPALARRFTPASVAPGTYVVYRSARSLDDLAAELSARDPDPSPGAWKPARQEALEALDGAGRADRFRIAELYVGIHPLVARGSLVRDGHREAYTLVSPYPDAALTQLEPGTLVIVFHIPF